MSLLFSDLVYKFGSVCIGRDRETESGVLGFKSSGQTVTVPDDLGSVRDHLPPPSLRVRLSSTTVTHVTLWLQISLTCVKEQFTHIQYANTFRDIAVSVILDTFSGQIFLCNVY